MGSLFLIFYLTDAITNAGSGVKIESGSYTGDGSRNTKTITFSFAPKVIIMGSYWKENGRDYYSGLFVVCGSGGLCCDHNEIFSQSSPSLYVVKSTISGNSVTIQVYNKYCINNYETIYTYVGIG